MEFAGVMQKLMIAVYVMELVYVQLLMKVLTMLEQAVFLLEMVHLNIRF